MLKVRERERKRERERERESCGASAINARGVTSGARRMEPLVAVSASTVDDDPWRALHK